MTLKRDRISIEVCRASAMSEAARAGADHANEATLILARLIGRQIAREQLAQKLRAERRTGRGEMSRSRKG